MIEWVGALSLPGECGSARSTRLGRGLARVTRSPAYSHLPRTQSKPQRVEDTPVLVTRPENVLAWYVRLVVPVAGGLARRVREQRYPPVQAHSAVLVGTKSNH